MKNLTAAQKRFIDNATLIAALRLIFQRLEESGVPVYRLNDVADTTSGGTPSRRVSSYYGGDIPWIKSGELNDGVIEQAEEFITEEGLKNSSTKIYPKGTLVIALYGATVGKTGILGIDAASNQAVCAVTPKTSEVSTNFLFWFLRYKRQDFLNISFGGAQPNISQKLLRETYLLIPDLKIQNRICEFFEVIERRQKGEKYLDLPGLPSPLEEQRRIVVRVEELVGKIEEVRSLRQQSLNEAEVLIKSALTSTFEKQSRKQGWEPQLLNQVTEIARGKFAHRPRNEPRFYGGDIPFIQIGDISNSNRYIQQYSQTLNQDGLSISRMFPKGTVVIAITGATIGVTGILTFDSCFPDSIVGIAAQKDDTIPEFIYWSLEYVKKVALAEAKQTTQPNINLKNLNKLKIPVPPIAEQHRIVAYLDNLQAKVDEMKRCREQGDERT
jgi:type I restriction enzyme S subunit